MRQMQKRESRQTAVNAVPNESQERSEDPGRDDPCRDKHILRPSGVGNHLILTYIIPFILFHAAAPLLFVPWLFSWSGLLLIPILHFVFDWCGIGLCYHRTLTHRGLTLPRWLERTLVVCGICTLMDSPARWVAIHRRHHQFTDDRPDPHSPWVTFWWGHMGWLIHENEDLSSADFYHRYAPDVLKDRFYLNIERYRLSYLLYFVHVVLLVAIGLIVGWWQTGQFRGAVQLGLSWFVWGVVGRTLFSWHATWAVNSVCHIWGYRNYNTRDHSTNQWLIALLTGGEGWHNNHHAHPVSAAHGHKWWECDPTYLNIRLLAAVGLARDVRTYSNSNFETPDAGTDDVLNTPLTRDADGK